MIPAYTPAPVVLPMEAHGRHKSASTGRGLVVIFCPDGDWSDAIGGGSTTTAPDGADVLLSPGRVGTAATMPLVTGPSANEIAFERDVPGMLAETKRLTGWNWDAIATVLRRSRQAVHAWTLGKEIAQENLNRLARLYATIKFIDRGDADENRMLLAQPTGDGRTITQLLEAGEFDAVRECLGQGTGRPQAAWAAIVSFESSAAESHWFDRVVAAAGGEADPDLEFVPRGRKKHLTLRRR